MSPGPGHTIVRDCLTEHLGAPDALWPLDSGPSSSVMGAQIAGRALVAKHYTDGRAGLVAERQGKLHGQLPPEASAQIPQTIFVDRARGIVVTEMLQGRRLDVAPSPDTLVRVGEALRAIHQLDPQSLPVTASSDHLADLVRPHPSTIAQDEPAWSAAISAGLDHIASISEIGTTAPVPIHRDFHLRQLIDMGVTIGIVDWDLVAAGDPAFDVATLRTYLFTHALDADGLLDTAFLAGYGSIDDRFRARVDGYRIFQLLRRACRRHRLRDGAWRAERDRMLERVSDLLGGRP